MLFALTAVLIVGVMAWALLGSTLLVVRSVRVTGNGRAVSAAQVVSAAGIAHGQPLIWVDTGAIARRVERLTQVQSAQVSKDWPTTLVIAVRLRTPVFSMAVHGGYALVDAYGVSLAEVGKRPRGLPVLTVHTASGTLRGSPAVRAAAAVLAELPGWVFRHVRGVTTGGPNDVSVTLASGAVVVWGGAERGAVKAKELTILMHRHARVYDVSGIGTAVTKG
jgi:cell division protein FtsQ